jgi:hypothetical protein
MIFPGRISIRERQLVRRPFRFPPTARAPAAVGGRGWGEAPDEPARRDARPTGSAGDGYGDHFAPLAHALIAFAIDRFVFPERARAGGGERIRVHVIGRRIDRQQDEAFAIAAVHLDLATAQIRAQSAPAPFHIHLRAGNRRADFRLDQSQIGRRLFAADDAEIGVDGGGGLAAVLDAIDEDEQSVQRAGIHRRGAVRDRRGRERGQRLRGRSGAGLGFLERVGEGERPRTGGGQPGLEHIDEPVAIGEGGRDLGRGEAEGGGVGREFCGKIAEPQDLVSLPGGIITISFHTGIGGLDRVLVMVGKLKPRTHGVPGHSGPNQPEKGVKTIPTSVVLG